MTDYSYSSSDAKITINSITDKTKVGEHAITLLIRNVGATDWQYQVIYDFAAPNDPT